jgi:hypothetical protein
MIDLGSIGSNIVQVQVLPIVILNFENGFSFEFSNKNPTRRQRMSPARGISLSSKIVKYHLKSVSRSLTSVRTSGNARPSVSRNQFYKAGIPETSFLILKKRF